jgi:TP901 family phage tail tape measure protein
MTNALGAKPVVDTSEFKSRLKDMNADLRVLESGFRASTATMGDWASQGSGLETRIKSLNDQIGVQKDKVALLKDQYEKIKAEKGEDALATKNAEDDYNKATETLGKMQYELGENTAALEEMANGEQEAGAGANELGEKSEEAGGKLEDFKAVLGGVGAAAKGVVIGLAAVAAAAVAAIGAMAGLALKSAENAEELSDMSVKTGISTTRLQELKYAGEIVGTSLDTITGANTRLIRSMSQARDGSGAQAEAFKTLGISVTDAQGNLLDSQSVFDQTIDALGKVTNPAERDALAMQLFGKSAQELNPLIAAGSSGLAQLATEAHNMGAVMDEESVKAAANFQDQLDGLKMGLTGVGGTIGSLLMPALSGIVGQAQGYLQDLVGIVQGSGGDINKMLNGWWEVDDEGQQVLHDGILGLVQGIIQDIAAQAPKMLQAGLTILQTILKAIQGALPTLLPAAVSILNALISFLISALPSLMESAVQILLTLVTAIMDNLPKLIGAAFQMIITLVQGIAAALPKLIPAIVDMLVMIIQTIIENLPLLLQAALQLVLGLVQGLVAALPKLIAAVPQILQAIVNTLILMLPVLVEMAPQILSALINGIISALPDLVDAIGQIIQTIIEVIIGLIPEIIKAGADILTGIWAGIESKLEWFWAKIKEFSENIWKKIKDFLGITSPSSVFADEVGRWIPAGIWEGIASGMPALQRQFSEAMRGLAIGYDITTGGRFAALGVSTATAGAIHTIQVGDIIIQVGNNASPLEVGRAAENGVLRALRAAGAA